VAVAWKVRSSRTRLGLAAATLAAAASIGAGAIGLSPVTAASAITMTTPFPAVAVAPGASPNFDIEVTTDQPGRVDLAVGKAPDGWTAVLRGGGFTIDGIESTGKVPTKVTLAVTVPADAAAGSQKIDVRGTTSSGASTTLTVDVRVTPAAAGDVTLTTDTPQLQGASNASFTFSLTLKNDTADDLPFSANVTGPAGWTVTAQVGSQAQAASVVVNAGATSPVSVTAKAPQDASAGDYPISVDVTSGSQTAHADLAVTITGTYTLSLSTSDQRLNLSASAGASSDLTLILSNTGTADIEAAKMTATAPTGWTVKFDPETDIAVPAQQQVSVVAHVTPSSDAIAGDYQATFKATAPEANASTDIRVTIETSLFWGAVGIGLIAIVLIGLWWTFQRFGRR
jgi:uncharacterized membrane protein